MNAIDHESPPNYAMIASNTEGYAPIDLEMLMKRALQQCGSRAFEEHGPKAPQVSGILRFCLVAMLVTYRLHKIILSMNDFLKAQDDFVPHALRDIPLQKSNVEWADIGGMSPVLALDFVDTTSFLNRAERSETHSTRNRGVAHQVRTSV